MIKIEKEEIVGLEPAIRGMRNPKNSWAKSDSDWYATDFDSEGECVNSQFVLGPKDLRLMNSLAAGGPVHAKYRRMIVVYMDIIAPLYWWKEFDTYKIGTVCNSCSTMHKIAAKQFDLEDFSNEHLLMENITGDVIDGGPDRMSCMPGQILDNIIWALNVCRYNFVNAERYDMETEEEFESRKKSYWWQMIQLLPSSYNQRRTIMLNYEVLSGIYLMRKNHKLDEWRKFCQWIEKLPHSELITGITDRK